MGAGDSFLDTVILYTDFLRPIQLACWHPGAEYGLFLDEQSRRQVDTPGGLGGREAFTGQTSLPAGLKRHSSDWSESLVRDRTKPFYVL